MSPSQDDQAPESSDPGQTEPEQAEGVVEALQRNILLILQWDGSDFSGWQYQNGQRTVQGEMTTALERMVRHPVKPIASSRTDAGVHAKGCPVSFETTRPIPLPNFVKGLNTALPPDISVLSAREIPLGHRPRDLAVAKTYTYRLQLGPRRALSERYAWSLKRDDFDVDLVREAAGHFLGEHDFSAFRSAQCDAKSTRRCIHSLDVLRDDDDLVSLVITGNAFLRNMVRIIAGTLVEVGLGRRSPDWVREVLANGDRRRAGQTAPPRGLTLTKVHFEGYPRLGKPAPGERPPTELLGRTGSAAATDLANDLAEDDGDEDND